MNSDEQNNSQQIELLYRALDDNQRTIQFTDTKAAAVLVLVGVITAFMAAVAKDFLKKLKEIYDLSSDSCYYMLLHISLVVVLVFSSSLVVAAVVIAFKTISPKSGPIESVTKDISSPIPNLFFLNGIKPKLGNFNAFRDKSGYFKHSLTTSQILTQVTSLNDETIKTVLVYELQKVSFIRDLKLERVKLSIKFLQGAIVLYASLSLLMVIQYLYN